MSNKTDIKKTTTNGKKTPKKLPKKAPAVKEKAVASVSGVSDTRRSKIELKQVVVGLVILCVAVLLFWISFGDIKKTDFWKMLFGDAKSQLFVPKNVIVGFSTTAEQDVTYDIYYTPVRETWFTEDYVIHVNGKKGTHFYHINLPVDKIYAFRLDFGSRPGAVTVHDVRLMGTQNADLSDFSQYQYNELQNATIDEKGDLSFVATERDPYMAYKYQLAK